MDKKFIVFVSLSKLIKSLDKDKILKILSTFQSSKEPDVQTFLFDQEKKDSLALNFEIRDRSRTYLWIDTLNNEVVAYFSIAIDIIQIEGLSKNLQKKINKGFLPAEEFIFSYLIGQLGRNERYNRSYITGKEILTYALAKIKEAKNIVGGRLVVIDINNVYQKPKLQKFYEEFGFKKLKQINKSLTRYYLILK